jgi:hypothetical protein
MVGAFVERRKLLTSLAEKHLSPEELRGLNLLPGTLLNGQAAAACALLEARGLDISDVLDRDPCSVYNCSVYEWGARRIDTWNQFWDAGFMVAGELDERVLWALAGAHAYQKDSRHVRFILERVEWLTSRGAKIHHVEGGIPVLPALSQILGLELSEHIIPLVMSDRLTELFHTIILDDIPDSCDCPCSIGGCVAFKHMCERILASASRRRKMKMPINDRTLSVVLRNINSTLTPGEERCFYGPIASGALRFITFCELGITHTCCYHYRKMDKETIHEIHEEEADLIQQLDKLVEEFSKAYEECSLLFHEFLKQVWKPRMDEILSERPSEEDVIELRRIGVTVCEVPSGVSWRSLLE